MSFCTAFVAAFTFLAPATLSAASLSITSALQETIGTTALIPGSGTADNTNTWSPGTVGVFEMNFGEFYMRVSATNPTGALNPSNDSLMVARTVNSQGLTDQGTLSVYVRGNPVTSSEWSLDLNFSFFQNQALTVPAPLTLLLTSLDIDYNQRYYTSLSTFSSNTTSTTSNIVSAAPQTGFAGFTAAGDSTVDNANHAVASAGAGSSFDVRIAHNNVALFMFEFRDPSTITGLVPEPSTALLGIAGMAAFAFVRKR